MSTEPSEKIVLPSPEQLERFEQNIKDNPASKRELALIQNTFNEWHKKSGLAYSHISRICACSV